MPLSTLVELEHAGLCAKVKGKTPTPQAKTLLPGFLGFLTKHQINPQIKIQIKPSTPSVPPHVRL
jgi:hypothetical protein